MNRSHFTKLGMHPGRVVAVLALVALIGQSAAAQQSAATPEELQQRRDAIAAKALDYLARQGQADDGTFTAQAGPGITALALTAAMRNGRSVDDPMVAKGLEALEGFVKPDGGIYGNGRLRNYETCVAVLCFTEANTDGRYQQIALGGKLLLGDLEPGVDRRGRAT